MKKILGLLFGFFIIATAQSQNKIKFYQTNWGNTDSWEQFCAKAKKSGYDGIEVWMPRDVKNASELKAALEKHNLSLILLHGTNRGVSFKESLVQYESGLEKAMQWKPDKINCHTGNDFFTQKQNKAYIDIATRISKKYNIPVLHETHRGRFSYSLPVTNEQLKLSPQLKLTLDISHWMVVHESLLQGKDEILEEVMERTGHIHARVGHAEGPQVNDPAAPEWKNAVERHLDIWEKIIRENWKKGNSIFTVTTEFGPPNYLPTLPYTKIPVANQWKANEYIMKVLKERLKQE